MGVGGGGHEGSSIGGDGTSAFLQFQDFFRRIFINFNFIAVFFHFEFYGESWP